MPFKREAEKLGEEASAMSGSGGGSSGDDDDDDDDGRADEYGRKLKDLKAKVKGKGKGKTTSQFYRTLVIPNKGKPRDCKKKYFLKGIIGLNSLGLRLVSV